MTTDRDLPRTPSFSLVGRRALVTGAGRGIGFALAAALAEAGAEVTLWARGAESIEAAAARLRTAGRSANAQAVDVSDRAAVEAALDAGPAFDILVSNAGTNIPQPFTEMTEDAFDTVMDLNVRAAFFTMQAVARRMIAEGVRGSIIQISSQAGLVGAAGRSAYTASKHATEGLTKVIAIELAPHGIRVNSICPTFIETEMTGPALADPAFRGFVEGKIKLGRLGQVEDLMGAAVFLASDAAALMTGSSLVVDGGWTAG
ncbi:SDR family oxidoreductase [Paracoccus sp. S-4012]|uniref:SDR family NAD(P)-dependent oxidoreductase n=1 Tax=Paracoccus sp. S-4012 TaxID=2665648 RepID=UPI0012B0FF64|nr:SDR family oxidoreductase [Paracoccus sp. S-4012]MRX48894.1 SDR family oxidoreductase [Paracoccus sp. S-4012]